MPEIYKLPNRNPNLQYVYRISIHLIFKVFPLCVYYSKGTRYFSNNTFLLMACWQWTSRGFGNCLRKRLLLVTFLCFIHSIRSYDGIIDFLLVCACWGQCSIVSSISLVTTRLFIAFQLTKQEQLQPNLRVTTKTYSLIYFHLRLYSNSWSWTPQSQAKNGIIIDSVLLHGFY